MEIRILFLYDKCITVLPKAATSTYCRYAANSPSPVAAHSGSAPEYNGGNRVQILVDKDFTQWLPQIFVHLAESS